MNNEVNLALKLSNRIGYSLVKPKNLKNFTNVNGIDLMGLETPDTNL